jgi:LmbE family N-acetylglucosaminyl deacetylase
MNVLVIAAHPDDEVLGCGGTIARLSKEGHEISIAILGEGLTSRFANRRDTSKKSIKAIQKCSREAAKLLGVAADHVLNFTLPDNRFDTVPLLDVVKMIEKIIDQTEPECVFTQHGADLNIDHAIVFRATLTATRPVTDTLVKQLYAYEVPSSTEWAFQKLEPRFTPNLFIDVSETLKLKIAAMQLYESERRDFPHPRSTEALEVIAKRWGSVAGVGAAEAFEIIREIR